MSCRVRSNVLQHQEGMGTGMWTLADAASEMGAHHIHNKLHASSQANLPKQKSLLPHDVECRLALFIKILVPAAKEYQLAINGWFLATAYRCFKEYPSFALDELANLLRGGLIDRGHIHICLMGTSNVSVDTLQAQLEGRILQRDRIYITTSLLIQLL